MRGNKCSYFKCGKSPRKNSGLGKFTSRPFNKEEIQKVSVSCIDVVNTSEIQVRQHYSRKSFHFERVFNSSSSQEDVFNKVVYPLILEVLKGYNCTIFAYGQTGSGKTHTIVGTKDQNAGIIPRSIDKLFEILKQDEIESNVRVSFLEIYNEELFDLFMADNQKVIRLYDDKNRKGSVIVQGLKEMTVNTKEEIYRYLEEGYEKRRTAPTLMNSQSSRSHCIFTITVHIREISPTGEDFVKMGKLNLVDLAGSENIGRSGSVDKRAREAGSINQSLLTLGRVIRALNEKSSHIPYRESKLTRILRDSLGGSAKTSLIATISSASINVEETVSTLEYAVKMRNIQNRPEINQHLSRSTLIHQYEQEIARLKKDLRACNTETGVCLNEENYLQMVNEQKSHKNVLNLKANHIECLERELKDITANLEIIQRSWQDAANNIESLTQQQRILEESLVLCKEETNKQTEELENFEVKHDRLVADSNELASVIEVQYKDEEILHKKLSSLYGASYHNEISAKEFCEAYNELNCTMRTELCSCIQFIQTVMKSGSESVFMLRTKLKETYSTLIKLMMCIIKNFKALERNKNEYFEMKDVFVSKIGDYIKELDHNIKETFTANSSIIKKIISVDLQNIDNIIQEINEDRHNYCNALASILNNITTHITESSNKVSHLLDSIQESAISKFQIMDDLNQDMLNKINSYALYAKNKKKDVHDRISAIRSKVLALQQTHSASTTLIEKSSEEIINLHGKMQKTNDDLRTLIIDSFDRIRNEIGEYSNHTSASVNKQISTIEDMKEKEICTHEKVNKEICDAIDKVNEQREYSDILCSDLKKRFAELGSNLKDNENKYNNYVAALSELRQSVCDKTNTSTALIDHMHKTISDINSQDIRDLSYVNSRVISTNKGLHENYSRMSKMIHEFSDVKLKCPTHAGDTPQCSQKAINLIANLNISPALD